MDIPGMLREYASLIKVVVVVAAVGAYTYGVYQWGGSNTAARYETKLAKQKQDANALLLKRTDELRTRERTLASRNMELEALHATDQGKLAEQDRKLRASVRAAGGLRDPGRRGDGGRCTQGQAASGAASHNAEASGARLSAEAEEFLFDLTRDADQVVLQLETAQKEYIALWEFCGGK